MAKSPPRQTNQPGYQMNNLDALLIGFAGSAKPS
jgi:hypothetical protein